MDDMYSCTIWWDFFFELKYLVCFNSIISAHFLLQTHWGSIDVYHYQRTTSCWLDTKPLPEVFVFRLSDPAEGSRCRWWCSGRRCCYLLGRQRAAGRYSRRRCRMVALAWGWWMYVWCGECDPFGLWCRCRNRRRIYYHCSLWRCNMDIQILVSRPSRCSSCLSLVHPLLSFPPRLIHRSLRRLRRGGCRMLIFQWQVPLH